MTNYHLDKIQSNIEAYLRTSPDADAVNSLIERLKEYESERQHASVQADLEWKTQLPENFPAYPRHKKVREQFRRMYNQLKTQGIFVTYSRLSSAGDVFQWNLSRRGQTGRLMFEKDSKKWTIAEFYFQDEEGNPIDEFSYVTSL